MVNLKFSNNIRWKSKTQNFKNPQRSFVRTIESKISKKKFENFRLLFVGIEKFQFQKFQKSQA